MTMDNPENYTAPHFSTLDAMVDKISRRLDFAWSDQANGLTYEELTSINSLIDQAIQFAATPEEYAATAIENVWWENNAIVEQVEARERELLAENREISLRALKLDSSAFGARQVNRFGMDYLSLLLTWKGVIYHLLSGDEAAKQWRGVFLLLADTLLGKLSSDLVVQLPSLMKQFVPDAPIPHFELIEDSYLRAIKASSRNDVAAVLLTHLYWMHERRQAVIQRWSPSRENFQEPLQSEEYDLYFEESRKSIGYYDWVVNLEPIIQFEVAPWYFPLSKFTSWIDVVNEFATDIWTTKDVARWNFHTACDWWDKVNIRDTRRHHQLFERAIELSSNTDDWFDYTFVYLFNEVAFGETEDTDGLEYFQMVSEKSESGTALETKGLQSLLADALETYITNVPNIKNDPRFPAILKWSITRLIRDLSLKDYPNHVLAHAEMLLAAGELSSAKEILARLFHSKDFKDDRISNLYGDVCLDTLDYENALKAFEALSRPREYLRQLKLVLRQLLQVPSPAIRAEFQATRDLVKSVVALHSEYAESIDERLTRIEKGTDTLVASVRKFDEIQSTISSILAGVDLDKRLDELHKSLLPDTEVVLDTLDRLGESALKFPRSFVVRLVVGNQLYHMLLANQVRNFTPVVLYWGASIEIGLRDGLLFPFAAWLDSRHYVGTIESGGTTRLKLTDYQGNQQPNWRAVLQRNVAADLILLAASRDDKHPLSVYFREVTNNLSLSDGWHKDEIFPKRLTELRRIRNDAAHTQVIVTSEQAKRFYTTLWGDSLVKDLCILLSTSQGTDKLS